MVKDVELDNRFVVPYNPALCLKFDAHINVEVCTSIASVKYLYKYVYKGHDRLVVELRGNENLGEVDEISQFLDCRYVSASESCWRIFGFNLHAHYPSVLHLPVHLPNQQMVYFDEDADREEVAQRNQATMLTRWFELNTIDVEARRYRYCDLPQEYVWNAQSKK